jgi:PAS domain S-box-containing protein
MSKVAIPLFSEGSFQRRVEMHESGHRSNHSVQFYFEDTALLDSLSRSIGTALGAGDAAVAIATKVHLDGLACRLKARGLDLTKVTETGRYIPWDAREALSRFVSEGWPDAIRFAEMIGNVIERAKSAAEGDEPRVFAFGEMVAILWAEGRPGSALYLEQLWNDLVKKHSFTLRCAYPLKAFDREEHGEPFLKICAEHSTVIPAENFTALIDEEQRLRDITRLQQKEQALETERAERERVQKSLHSREAELTDLLENALEGILQTGPDRRVRWANKALLHLLRFSAEEVVGHDFAEFHVHRHIVEEFWGKLMRGEDLYDFAAEFKCKDGSMKHVLIHCNGLWENGKLVHTRSFIRDVTERKEMELALKLAHEELETRVNERTQELKQKNLQFLEQAETLELTNQGLRKLSAHILQVQDEERRRIARDLHDSTGQSLALLSMNLSALESEVVNSNPRVAEALSENIAIVKQISAELRTLSYLLHPPLLDEMGLESALRWYVDGFGQRSSIKVNLELPGRLERLPRNLEIAIFRVVQECLTNIHLHSESPTATIRLSRSPGKIILEVQDEGKGIAPDKLSKVSSSGLSGLGLRGMRERIKDFQGDLEIVSHNKGTQIKVVVPLASAAAAAS